MTYNSNYVHSYKKNYILDGYQLLYNILYYYYTWHIVVKV